jgi:hypothetical protein
MSAKIKTILVLSFGLNVAFAAVWFGHSPTPPATPMPSAAAGTSASNAKKDKSHLAAVRTVTKTLDKELNWASVESEDYRKYIENLRKVGCPEETIRDIIIADVNKLYAAKIAALYPAPREMKFWAVNDRAARNEEKERDKKRHELEDEKKDLLQELLGINYDSEMARNSGRPSDDDWRYGFLPVEKQAEAKALHDKYREMEHALFKDGNGWTAENRAKYTALRAEREAEMAKLLGPDFEEYQLRNSWTARHMRENLTAFQPSEDEFRQIFQFQKNFDDQFAFTRDGSDEAIRDQRKQGEQQLEDQLKALLGENRYNEFQMSQDERYRDIYDFAQRYDLPRQTANAMYAARAAAEQEKKRIEQDQSLTPDVKKGALDDLAMQTSDGLKQMLGNNWDNYQSRAGGWINRLNQTDSKHHSSHDRYSRH